MIMGKSVMVKIPKFNDLKKMGEDLASSAKGSKIFDKIKTSVDSLGAGSTSDDIDCGDAKTPIERCVKLINELQEVKRMEANLFNSLKAEITQIAKEAAADAESSAQAKQETAASDEPVAAPEEVPPEAQSENPEASQQEAPEDQTLGDGSVNEEK